MPQAQHCLVDQMRFPQGRNADGKMVHHSLFDLVFINKGANTRILERMPAWRKRKASSRKVTAKKSTPC
jgi:hypothetical protein